VGLNGGSMSITLTHKHIAHMLLGSSIYSTGGGLEYGAQKKLFAGLLKQQKNL